MDIAIRNENESDFRLVEELTREAFWNLYVPGCDEHYLAHVMRGHPDFIAEMDFVAALDGKIVGNIMSVKSRLVCEPDLSLETITFGPVSVLPEYQRRGLGSALIQHTIEKARSDKYKAIIIQGYPYNYCKHGFVGSKIANVCDSEDKYPYSLLVLELEKGCLKDHLWKFYPSDVYDVDETALIEFDKLFSIKKKGYSPSQEVFRISSNAYIM